MKTFGWIVALAVASVAALVAFGHMDLDVKAKATPKGKQVVRKGVSKANQGVDVVQQKLSEKLDAALEVAAEE